MLVSQREPLPASASAPISVQPPGIFRRALIPLALIAATLAVYWPILHFDFVTIDDEVTVYDNAKLIHLNGLSLYSFWTEPQSSLYAPLTYSVYAAIVWCQRALDVHPRAFPDGTYPTTVPFGMSPGPFHAVSIAVHMLTVLVVYCMLRRLIGRRWPAAGGAMLFAVHPVQVESVAWVTALNGLLCGMLSLAAIHVYLRATQGKASAADPVILRPPSRRERIGFYALATEVFIMAMLSKPLGVMVPLLGMVIVWMLRRRANQTTIRPATVSATSSKSDSEFLNDVKQTTAADDGSAAREVSDPLNPCDPPAESHAPDDRSAIDGGVRFAPQAVPLNGGVIHPLGIAQSCDAGATRPPRRTLRKLWTLFRALPFGLLFWLILAIPMAVIARHAQPVPTWWVIVPIWLRPAVAYDALYFYVYKAFFPIWLTVDYNRSPEFIFANDYEFYTWVVPAALIVLSVVLWRRRKGAVVLASIFWFAVGLLPVLGFTVFAFQRMSTVADRYMYLPMFGVALFAAWGLDVLTRKDAARPWRRKLTIALAVMALAGLGVRSRYQTGHWRDGGAIYKHNKDIAGRGPGSTGVPYNDAMNDAAG